MVRLAACSAVIALCLGAAGAAAETPFERQVLAALNLARTDPEYYAAGLARYRTYFRGKFLRYPGAGEEMETGEGVAAVDETIDFLGRQARIGSVAGSPLLAAVAADLVADQAGGGTGHDSQDGSGPADRAGKRGGGAYVAEVISYGPIDADDVVRQLVIDDGVADRGHRAILFSPELRFAGVACGPHAEYRTVCVIDLSATAEGRDGEDRPAGQIPVKTG